MRNRIDRPGFGNNPGAAGVDVLRILREENMLMKRSLRFGLATVFFLAAAVAFAAATSNLNLSKSNVYRLTASSDILTTAQAQAMLADLDTHAPMNEEQLKMWLPANFKRFGINQQLVKKIVILPPGAAGPQTAIILLSDPADEAAARSTTVKSSKSNSSE